MKRQVKEMITFQCDRCKKEVESARMGLPHKWEYLALAGKGVLVCPDCDRALKQIVKDVDEIRDKRIAEWLSRL